MLYIILYCLLATWFIMQNPMSIFIVWLIAWIPVVGVFTTKGDFHQLKRDTLAVTVYLIVAFIVSVMIH